MMDRWDRGNCVDELDWVPSMLGCFLTLGLGCCGWQSVCNRWFINTSKFTVCKQVKFTKWQAQLVISRVTEWLQNTIGSVIEVCLLQR
jgi:hypothetical protein